MIRRQKTTIFMDAKETTLILELKKMVQGITKKSPDDMKLFKDEQVSTTLYTIIVHLYSTK